MNHSLGYLEVILGPMFSGKTSRIIDIYKQYTFCNVPVTVINHSIDNRYDEQLLSTHDHIKIPCVKSDNLMSIPLRDSEVFLINEGQFFPDLKEFVVARLAEKKKVYVCGLDGDFEQKPIGQMLDLIPLADKVTKQTSLCASCKNGTPAIFSKRLSQEKEQIVVGSDNYIPVCRACLSDCKSKNTTDELYKQIKHTEKAQKTRQLSSDPFVRDFIRCSLIEDASGRLMKTELAQEFKIWARGNTTLSLEKGTKKIREYMDNKYNNYETYKCWRGIRVKTPDDILNEMNHSVITEKVLNEEE